MNTEELPVRELAVGTLLTAFFLLGLATGTFLQDDSGNAAEASPDMVDSETAVSNGESYLKNGPLSYPFTYNLSTEKVEKIELGSTRMYNWTVSYTVEANPFEGPTYAVPGNQTETRKTLSIYITGDGGYVFPSEPIKITQ